MQLRRDEVKKAKAYLVLKLASDAKGKRKIPQVHKEQKEDYEKHGPLLNGAGVLVKKDLEKAKVSNAFFVSVFTSKTSFQEAPKTKIWSKADLASDKNQGRDYLNTLEIRKTMGA